MSRRGLATAAGLLLVVGTGLLWIRADGLVRPASEEAGAGRPSSSEAAQDAALDPMGRPGVRPAAGDPGGAPPPPPEDPPDDAVRGSLALSTTEADRLVAAVGSRGHLALAEDDATREVYHRLQAAGDWTFDRLVTQLPSSDRDLRQGAAILLSLRGRSDSVRPIADALEHESDAAARRVFLEALVGLESTEAADALRRTWSDTRSSPEVRRIALQGLASLGDGIARAVVADPRADPLDRRVAEIGLVHALQSRGTEDPALLEVVRSIARESPDASIRRAAADVIAGPR